VGIFKRRSSDGPSAGTKQKLFVWFKQKLRRFYTAFGRLLYDLTFLTTEPLRQIPWEGSTDDAKALAEACELFLVTTNISFGGSQKKDLGVY
jgi:hypothetical protein